MSPTLLVPFAMLVVLAAMWGAGFTLAKIAGQWAIPPVGYTFWQALISGVVLTALASLRSAPPPAARAHLVYYLITGLIAFALPAVNSFIVLTHVPAGVMGVLTTLTPILTYGLSIPFGLDRVIARRMLGIAIGFAGTLLLVLPRASLPSPEMTGWVVLGVLTPALYASSNIYIAKARPAGVNSLALAGGMQLAAAACMLVLAVASDQVYWPRAPFTAGDAVMVVHGLIQALGMLFLFEIMRLAGPVFLSQVGFLSPISSISWGMLVFGEQHSAWFYAAMVVIFAGLLLVSAPSRAKAISNSRG